MKYYDAITRDQPSTGGWAKILTLYQNYMGVTDWHDNNVTFKVYQTSGDDYYIEKNYYISNYKGSNLSDTIQFYDLDDAKGAIACCYVLDASNKKIDVYVKGGRNGVPLKIKITQCSQIGKLELHQWRGFEDLSDMEIVTPSVLNPYYFFPVTNDASPFGIREENSDQYKEYSANRYNVTMIATLSVTNHDFTGDGYLFTIYQDYVPTWAFSKGKDYVAFTQDYSYKPYSGGRVFSKCRVFIYKNGQVKVAGMKALDETLASEDLYLNISYKRMN